MIEERTPGGTTAARERRLREGFFEKYLVGRGLDIGCGEDPVTLDCDRWDACLGHGDATTLEGVAAESYDWVYSSHCLEHLSDPMQVLNRWWEVLRPGGHLIVVVPDEDLYEQGVWPSRFNVDHKWTFTIEKFNSWSPVSRNLSDLILGLYGAKVVSLRRLDTGYDYTGGVWDRTLLGQEAHVEAVVRKGTG